MGGMNRWLPEQQQQHHPQLHLLSPVPRSSHRQLNFYVGIVLVVLMAVSMLALVCCCYHLEWRLRLQARYAARRAHRVNAILAPHEIIRKLKQETNLSVMMPGDSIPSFLANAKPHGSSPGVEFSDLLANEAKDGSHALR